MLRILNMAIDLETITNPSPCKNSYEASKVREHKNSCIYHLKLSNLMYQHSTLSNIITISSSSTLLLDECVYNVYIREVKGIRQ